MSNVQSVVAWLSDPGTHADRPDRVEVHETHISWVFVTRQFAYKLKKPVRFPFLDFQQLDARRLACEDEVRLNRRLAHDVYLGAIRVTRSADGGFALDGDGETVDWVVKMRRLDAERRCDALLSRDQAGGEQLSELANVLAHFYRHAPVRAIDPVDHVAAHEAHVQSNRSDLLECIGESARSTVQRVHAEQLVFIRLFGESFHDRVCEGRVVDGHGDLRPEHVYFYSPPKIVDCIEFNPTYRTVDVCDDLSFFAMECAALGKAEAGRQLVRECLSGLGDAPPGELINFYISYRASVRAKIALTAPDPSTLDHAGKTERALHYLHIAESHAPLASPPWLLVVCGGIGTGKSTLARRLAHDLGFEHLQTDVVRQELFDGGRRGAEVDQGIYTPANRLQVYRELFQRAVRLLDEGIGVVVDGSFQLADAWHELERLLPHTRARVLVALCRCSPDLARRRIEQRLAQGTDKSEARPEMIRDFAAAHADIPENLPRVSVDTINRTEVLADCVFRRMRAMY